MKTKKLAAVIATLLAGALTANTAQAVPTASGESIVSFENFTINHLGGAQVARSDFSSFSATATLQTTANTPAGAPPSNPPGGFVSTGTGQNLAIQTIAGGPVNNGINGFPVTATNTVFNAVTLPLVGNFAASGANDEGAPITGFFSSTSPSNLHNGSYASLDTIQGSAGTNAHSSLDSSFVFSLTTASALHFDFNLGVYIAAFLSANAAQVAHANWSLGFTLTDTNDTSISHILSSSGVIIPGFSLGDTVSNNAPGTGTTRTGSQNSALNLNGTPVLTNRFFNTDVLAGNTSYTLSAFIDTGANVTTVAVPEPEALALLGMGLLGMAASSRKFKNLFRLTNA